MITKTTSIHAYSQWVGGTSLWYQVLLVFGSYSVLYVLWMKDSVDLLELLWEGFKEVCCSRLTQVRRWFCLRREKKCEILLSSYPNTGMCMWKSCVHVCVCACIDSVVCSPFFSPPLCLFSLSISLFSFPTCTPLMSPSWFGDGSVSHDAPAPGSGGPVQGWRSFASSSACLSSSSLHRAYKEMRGTTKKRVKIKKASVPNNKKVRKGEREAGAHS